MPYMRLAANALMALLSFAAQGQTNYFTSDRFIYDRAETYKSIFGGTVSVLEPSGYDFIHDSAWAMLVEGVISNETASNVASALASNPGIRLIFLNSPGGDLFAGLKIGKLLHQGHFQTIITEESYCQSACALAFLGGESRVVLSPSDHLGFHRQYYIVNNKIKYGSWQKDKLTINQYLTEIEFFGLSAQEIIGSTESLTFSDRRLVDRKISTMSRDTHAALVDENLRATGASIYEKFSAACILLKIDCGTIEPPFRLPMLLSYYKRHPSDLPATRTTQQLRPWMLAAAPQSKYGTPNCMLMKDRYLRYIENRFQFFLSTNPPPTMIQNYKTNSDAEYSNCQKILPLINQRAAE